MMKLLAALLVVFSSLAHAEVPLQSDLSLGYLAQASADTKDKPLVIFIHGYGSNEQDLFDIKDRLPADYTYLSLRAPLELEQGSYQWFHKRPDVSEYDGDTGDLKNSVSLITLFIQQATAKYQTEPDKVILIGFSQGAVMTYEIGLRHPEIVRGIAALSGKILPVLRSEVQANDKLNKLSVFVGHGTADVRLPFKGATDAVSLLQRLSVKPEFHAYQGMGHTINDNEIADLDHWLEETIKGA